MTPARTDRALVVHPELSVRQDVEGVLRKVHRHAVAVRHAATAGVALQVAREHDPRIVLLDLEHERAVSLAVARELRRPGRVVIGMLNPLLQSDGSAEFLRQAVRAGVNEFVAVPLADGELAAALEVVPEASTDAEEGKTIACFSHQGGVGTTALAINLAFALAGDRKRVAILDANVQFGSVAVQLGLVPETDLATAVRELDGGGMLPVTLAGRDPGIAVVSSPADILAAETVRPQDVARVLIELRRTFESVVVDTAPSMDAVTLAVLDLAETIVVVTEGSSHTVAGTARLLRILKELGFGDERVRLVMNRYRSAADVVPPEVVAEQLGRDIDEVLPFMAPVAAASHRGVPALFERAAGHYREGVVRLAKGLSRKEGRR